jgi:hypothetical protein
MIQEGDIVRVNVRGLIGSWVDGKTGKVIRIHEHYAREVQVELQIERYRTQVPYSWLTPEADEPIIVRGE